MISTRAATVIQGKWKQVCERRRSYIYCDYYCGLPRVKVYLYLLETKIVFSIFKCYDGMDISIGLSLLHDCSENNVPRSRRPTH